MSTAFFWDKGKNSFICERRGIGLKDFSKDLTYIFNSIEDIVKLLTANRETIIYSECDVAFTVDSLIFEIAKRGFIVVVSNYYEVNEE